MVTNPVASLNGCLGRRSRGHVAMGNVVVMGNIIVSMGHVAVHLQLIILLVAIWHVGLVTKQLLVVVRHLLMSVALVELVLVTVAIGTVLLPVPTEALVPGVVDHVMLHVTAL